MENTYIVYMYVLNLKRYPNGIYRTKMCTKYIIYTSIINCRWWIINYYKLKSTRKKKKNLCCTKTNLVLAKSWSLPVLEKIINPTSASQRIASSLAFFNNPLLLFENVTCRLVELSILRITIFPLPIIITIQIHRSPPDTSIHIHIRIRVYVRIYKISDESENEEIFTNSQVKLEDCVYMYTKMSGNPLIREIKWLISKLKINEKRKKTHMDRRRRRRRRNTHHIHLLCVWKFQICM